MNKFRMNDWNTTHLVLNVMEGVARFLKLDITNDITSDALYWICCSLEDFPEDEGFGSSDDYSQVQEAKRVFHIVPPSPLRGLTTPY